MAANATQATPSTNWSYGATADGQVHENPEWEKARQALASINKSQSSAKATPANRTTAEAGQFQPAVTDSAAMQQQQQQQQQQYYPWYQQTQQHYPGYTYPYNYYYPMGPYGAAYPPNQYGVPPGPYPGTPTSNGQVHNNFFLTHVTYLRLVVTHRPPNYITGTILDLTDEILSLTLLIVESKNYEDLT